MIRPPPSSTLFPTPPLSRPQAGWRAAPALEASPGPRSPSRTYIIGVVRGRPVRAPVVVSRTSWRPPRSPPLARNCSISFRLYALMSAGISVIRITLVPSPPVRAGVLVHHQARGVHRLEVAAVQVAERP